MNLSSYLQMPPAPLVPNHTSNAVPQGTRTAVGPSADGGMGFDFAQVMARQMARLVPQERQTFAAEVPETQPRAVENQRTSERPERDTQEKETRADNEASPTERDTEASTAHARQRNKTNKTKPTDTDALLESLMQGAPVVPATIVPASASSEAAPPDLQAPVTPTGATAVSLQTIELSPHMRIITDPQKAPSPESLAAFAKSMGLGESEIQNLLGQAPATPTTALAGKSTATAALGAGVPTDFATAMPALLKGAQPSAASPLESAVATQLSAMTEAAAATPVAASGAGLAAAATTLKATPLPGLTATDMASIQQLQITVLPAAVLPVNTAVANNPMPSTIDMLSLLGTGVDEPQVSALLSRFSEDAGSEGQPDQQASSDESNPFSSLSQALTTPKNAANTLPANATPTTTANMSEVYDQLSDKMATELAARMHKQLSDGEWKMKFALRPSNLGGVEIQLEMKDGKLDAVFRADNPLTRDLLQNSSQRLREALGNFGINAGQVNVGQGGGNTPQNNAGNAGKHSQVRDNSSSQVKGAGDASGVTSARSKANASLLDLYA